MAMKVSDDQAHVCLGEGEVKPGDKVTLFTNQCTPDASKTGGKNLCKKVPVGEGVISQILNEHYSVMSVSKGTPIDEGTIVEKMTR
ncbi:MAG TPA: hypothetical protein VFV50_15145 [Bdellovibrionales bacterium]|nr:hypothetical protein [Bdellovibrionales bacterium]